MIGYREASSTIAQYVRYLFAGFKRGRWAGARLVSLNYSASSARESGSRVLTLFNYLFTRASEINSYLVCAAFSSAADFSSRRGIKSRDSQDSQDFAVRSRLLLSRTVYAGRVCRRNLIWCYRVSWIKISQCRITRAVQRHTHDETTRGDVDRRDHARGPLVCRTRGSYHISVLPDFGERSARKRHRLIRDAFHTDERDLRVRHVNSYEPRGVSSLKLPWRLSDRLFTW